MSFYLIIYNTVNIKKDTVNIKKDTVNIKKMGVFMIVFMAWLLVAVVFLTFAITILSGMRETDLNELIRNTKTNIDLKNKLGVKGCKYYK